MKTIKKIDNQTERDSIEQFWFSDDVCLFCFTVDELESNNQENSVCICPIIPPNFDVRQKKKKYPSS